MKLEWVRQDLDPFDLPSVLWHQSHRRRVCPSCRRFRLPTSGSWTSRPHEIRTLNECRILTYHRRRNFSCRSRAVHHRLESCLHCRLDVPEHTSAIIPTASSRCSLLEHPPRHFRFPKHSALSSSQFRPHVVSLSSSLLRVQHPKFTSPFIIESLQHQTYPHHPRLLPGVPRRSRPIIPSDPPRRCQNQERVPSVSELVSIERKGAALEIRHGFLHKRAVLKISKDHSQSKP